MFCLCGVLENLIGQHGQSNVQSAMNNNMMGALTSQLGQAIQCAPGIPQFARDEMCQALQSVAQSCPQEPTPPGCQEDTDNAMSGLIDKIVDKVVDKIMQKLQGGGECENGGSFKDMVRESIEEVVREQIGGGSEDGGCAANGGAADGGAAAGASASESSDVGDTSDPGDSLLNRCSQDENKEKSKSGSWLVALARAMGEMTGRHLTKMMDAQDAMEASEVDETSDKWKNASEKEQSEMKKEAGREFTKAQAEFQAESKLFSMCSEATSTVLKSIGEGLSSMARKQ
jgi:hypothetical protein